MTEENTFELTGDQYLIQSSKNFALIIDGEVADDEALAAWDHVVIPEAKDAEVEY